jgi:hypothetical protein
MTNGVSRIESKRRCPENWYWFVSALFAVAFLSRLYPILADQLIFFDYIVILGLVSLLFMPLLEEFSFFGLSFKRTIQAVGSEIRSDISQLRSDFIISSLMGVAPQSDAIPSESELEETKQKIDAKPRPVAQATALPQPPEEATYMFSVRYTLEKEIGRIWSRKMAPLDPQVQWRLPFGFLVKTLDEREILDHDMARASRSVYSICSAVVHHRSVSRCCIEFVQYAAPRLLSYLQEV